MSRFDKAREAIQFYSKKLDKAEAEEQRLATELKNTSEELYRAREELRLLKKENETGPLMQVANLLWEDIILKRHPDYGTWEYPGQLYRHIVAEFEETVRLRDLHKRNCAELLGKLDDTQRRLFTTLVKEQKMDDQTGARRVQATQVYSCKIAVSTGSLWIEVNAAGEFEAVKKAREQAVGMGHIAAESAPVEVLRR